MHHSARNDQFFFHTFLLALETDYSKFTTGCAHYRQLIWAFVAKPSMQLSENHKFLKVWKLFKHDENVLRLILRNASERNGWKCQRNGSLFPNICAILFESFFIAKYADLKLGKIKEKHSIGIILNNFEKKPFNIVRCRTENWNIHVFLSPLINKITGSQPVRDINKNRVQFLTKWLFE